MFDPAPNVRGVAVVTVIVSDTGGTANGGVDTGVMQFEIDVEKPRPWRNTARPLDVTADGNVVAGDVLKVIDYINAFEAGLLPPRAAIEPPYYDVNGDLSISAGDALAIIEAINAGLEGEGGEGATTSGDDEGGAWRAHQKVPA